MYLPDLSQEDLDEVCSVTSRSSSDKFIIVYEATIPANVIPLLCLHPVLVCIDVIRLAWRNMFPSLK